MTSDAAVSAIAQDNAAPPAAPALAEEAPPRGGPSLTARTSTGFATMAVVSLLTRGSMSLAQLALAYILAPRDFGLISLAVAAAAFPAVLNASGVRDILVQRHDRFKRWAVPGMWLSQTFAVAAAGLIAAAAPLAAQIYGDPRLLGLMLLIALQTLLNPLSVVPNAYLTSQLRFGKVAKIQLLNAVLGAAGTVVYALLGFGPASWFLGPITAQLPTAWIYWNSIPLRPSLRLRVRRWRFLIGDSSRILATQFIWVFVSQGDRLLLGALTTTAVVGTYFFAFSLSMQIVQLLAVNLSGVLFPVVAKLKGDPVRQTQAFLRAAQSLALLAVPAAFMLGAVADPALRLAFGPKWVGAIPIVQVLSFGMAAYVVSYLAYSIIQAQARFGPYLKFAAASASLFLVNISIGAAIGGRLGGESGSAVGIAAAVSIHFWGSSIAGLHLGISPAGYGLRDILRLYRPSVLASLCAIAPAWLLGVWVVPGVDTISNLLRLLLIAAVGSLLYLLVIPHFARRDWRDTLDVVWGAVPRRLRGLRRFAVWEPKT